jgi:hypothetical protein
MHLRVRPIKQADPEWASRIVVSGVRASRGGRGWLARYQTRRQTHRFTIPAHYRGQGKRGDHGISGSTHKSKSPQRAVASGDQAARGRAPPLPQASRQRFTYASLAFDSLLGGLGGSLKGTDRARLLLRLLVVSAEEPVPLTDARSRPAPAQEHRGWDRDGVEDEREHPGRVLFAEVISGRNVRKIADGGSKRARHLKLRCTNRHRHAHRLMQKWTKDRPPPPISPFGCAYKSRNTP